MSVITITSENFQEEVMNSDKPVLIDFWAEWCGPCRMLSPVVDQVAEEVDTVKIGKINVDNDPELAKKYGVMSIPTLILIKNGEVVATSVGVKPKAEIKKLIEA